MFKPVAMSRASIVVLERDERAVLRWLGRLGVLQLTRTPAGPDSAPSPPRDCTRELAQCDRLTARVQELRRSLELKEFSEPAPLPAEMTLSQAAETIAALEKTAGELLKNRQQLAGRFGELTTTGELLSDYRGLDLPLDATDASSFLHFVTGSLPSENFQKIQNEIGAHTALLPLPERNGRQPLLAMTTRQGRPALEKVLQQAGFQAEALPVMAGATVDAAAAENRREQERLVAELERLDADRQTLAEKLAVPLAKIKSAVETERRLLEAGQNFSRTESAVLLTGWIPSADSLAVEKHLREITGARCVVEIAAPQNSTGESIPVLLRHPRWLRPFAMLVTAYGLPQYHELEPTLFVAISYLLMFGMMFGDAGHGAILALAGLATFFAGRKIQTRNIGLLLLSGGCSSMIFGALYGSCFGIPALKKFALWHDPLEGNPMNLMTGAIEIGIVMISLGLLLNVLNFFRRGDVVGGLLDKFGVAGMVFYWGALALFVKSAAFASRGLTHLAVILFLVLPAIGWMLKEPVRHFLHRRAGHPVEADAGFFSSVMESLVGVFEAVLSYFANTVSFVRLAAYAMSHAALLVAAFMIAADVKHISAGGNLLSVLVIILGNLVVIVLESIVASIQSLRLEYYEFFGKFFSGGGQPFKPFCLQTTTVAETPL